MEFAESFKYNKTVGVEKNLGMIIKAHVQPTGICKTCFETKPKQDILPTNIVINGLVFPQIKGIKKSFSFMIC
jgi:hypothetical protein